MGKDRQGNADSGNRYENTYIHHVETYAPNAEKVENNHTHTVTVHVNISFSMKQRRYGAGHFANLFLDVRRIQCHRLRRGLASAVRTLVSWKKRLIRKRRLLHAS